MFERCVDVVIVNWNAGTQLGACLAAVARSDSASSSVLRSVVVVDNASSDASLDQLPETVVPLTVIRNSANRGFAAACNQGAARGSAEFVLFLNPDVRVEPTTLATAVAALRRAPGSAALGVQLLDDEGHVARSCARFPSTLTMVARALGIDRLWPERLSYVMTYWDHEHTRTVDHVIGAFYLVRRSVFTSVGAFDERFFVYLEDLDLSLRISRSGCSCLYVAEARAYHRGGGTSDQVRDRRLAYALRSRLAYAAKHLSLPGLVAVCIATLAMEPIVRVLWAGVRLSGAEIRETTAGFIWLWRDLTRLGLHSPMTAASRNTRGPG
jgi:N-acetylglucosaminyl-diphospho-decaprenol L-rhamnosyltransferase